MLVTLYDGYTQPRMTDLKPEEVEHLASLSRLSLSESEKKEFSEQLPQILDFVDQLKEADKLNSATPIKFKQEQLREDIEDSDSLSLDQLEKLAPKWQDNQVLVPPVFGDNNDV